MTDALLPERRVSICRGSEAEFFQFGSQICGELAGSSVIEMQSIKKIGGKIEVQGIESIVIIPKLHTQTFKISSELRGEFGAWPGSVGSQIENGKNVPFFAKSGYFSAYFKLRE